jgi:hypothetical protein
MAVVVTHATTATGTDNGNGEIGKSEWNANHTVAGLGTMAEATAADYSTTAQIAAAYQPLDSDLTTIAGLTATTNNFIQSASSAWASRTPTQVTATLIDMVGDSGSGGTKGLVPAPAAGDAAASKFLKADGVWTAVAATPGGSDTQIQFNDSSAFGGDAGLVFNKTTNALTGTGLWTVTQATANTGIFASTGYSLTGSDATGMINLAGTWNTSGNPIALKIAMTNTASGSTSKFISLLAGAAGATEFFSVAKNGNISWGNNSDFYARMTTLASADFLWDSSGTTATMFHSSVRTTLRSGGSFGWCSDANNANNGFDTAINRAAAGVVKFTTTGTVGGGISFPVVAKTIASGAIAVTSSHIVVDTEAAAASDDLDTITGGQDGQILVVTAANSARDVVVKDGTGNIQCAGDCTLDNIQDTITLFYNATQTAWLELCRSNNGA